VRRCSSWRAARWSRTIPDGSEKAADDENGWRHTRVVLESLNPEIADIEIGPDQDVDVIATFETVLGAVATPSAAQR
jgi:hypothetical protein